MVVAVSQVIILLVMDRAILKTLENRLKEKVGQTVQSLDIISQEFIVVLVTGLKTLTNFDVVKWVQVMKLPVELFYDVFNKQLLLNCISEIAEEMPLLVSCVYTVESYYEHLLTSKWMNYIGEEHKDNLT